MEVGSRLPPGFDSLDAFVDDWVLPDSAARSRYRQASSIGHIREFYDAMLPIAEKAIDHLRDVPLGAMPASSERLLKLMLSLAEIAPAIEWYNAPSVYDGFDVKRINLVRQVTDTDVQI